MSKILTLEVFKAGEQTDSQGISRVWTIDDLDAIANKYNNQTESERRDAPIVIGHPQTDDPAYGWVKTLYRKGDILFADIGDLNEDFVQALTKGSYRKRSISLYPDLMLKHIGFLGGVAPAIKGLRDPVIDNYQANTDDITIYEFSEVEVAKSTDEEEKLIDDTDKQDNQKKSFQIHELNQLEKFNQITEIKMNEEKDKHIADEFIKEVATNAQDQFGSEVAQQLMTLMQDKKELIAVKETDSLTDEDPKFSEFKQTAEFQAMREQIELSNRKIQLLEQENLKKDNEAYFNEQVQSGNLLPKQKEVVMLALAIAGSNSNITFNEKDVNMPNVIKGVIASFGKQVHLNEFASQDKAEESNEKGILAGIVKNFNDRRRL